MAAGSLVVRISANINDFSRNLQKMTRDVSKAADTIAGVGKKLTLGLTVPAALAGAALAKMALENQEVSKKMARVFGEATGDMQAKLDAFAGMVPVAGTELQQMATDLAELGDDLGATGSQAKDFSAAVLDIAVKLAAAKNVDLSQSVEAVGNAMKGQLKGLKSLGVVITDTQIKEAAYRTGLMRSGETLNEYGTMLATVAVLQQRTAKWSTEAAVRQEDLATQFRLAKVALSEFADATSSVLLPVLAPMVKTFKEFTEWLNKTDESTRKLVITLIAFGAALGPLLVVVATLVKTVSAVAAALTLISAPVWLAIATGVGVLTGAIVLLNKAFKDTQDNANFGTALQFTTVAPYTRAAAGLKPQGATTKPGGASEFTVPGFSDPGLDYGQLGSFASNLNAAFTQAIDAGRPLTTILAEMNRLNQVAAHLYDTQANKLSEIALEAQRIYLDTKRTLQLENAATGGNSYGGANTQRGVRELVSGASDGGRNYARQDLNNRVWQEAQLQFREFALKLPDMFDAPRVAAIQFGEGLRASANDAALSFELFKKQFSSWNNVGASAIDGVKQAAAGLTKEFSIQALVMKIISDILSGIGPQIEAVFSSFKELGGIIGILVNPIFRALFAVIRDFVTLIGYLLGGIVRIVAVISDFTAKFSKVGSFLTFGTQGPAKKLGEAAKRLADGAYKMSDDLLRASDKLGGKSWDEALNGVNALGDAAARTAEELINLPSSFKYALRKFQAQTPTTVDESIFGPPGSGAVTGGANNARLMVLPIHLDGKLLTQVVIDRWTGAAQAQLGDRGRIMDVRNLR